YINSEIVWSHLSPEVKLTFTKPQEEDMRITLDICDKLVSKGVLTINEARKRLGEKAIDGGDIPIIHTGSSVIPLSLVGTQLAVSTKGFAAQTPTFKSTAGFTPLLRDDLQNENFRSEEGRGGTLPLQRINGGIYPAGGEQMSRLSTIGKQSITSVGQPSRLTTSLLSEYESIHDKTGKWLIKELTKAYFKGDRTDQIIDRACSQLFGKMRNAAQQHHTESDGGLHTETNNLIRDKYLSPIETTLKTALVKFAKGKSLTQAGLMKALDEAYTKCKTKLQDCVK
ncbi:hypothetical protein KKB18_02990, partial [bacterium]|nr:hypothetical protein [bacterium]